jgi:hypothetical protein
VVNYIRDRNRWNLSAPPAWWQQQLFDYDPLLVVIPSRQMPVYRIARRARVSIKPLDIVNTEADTAMLATYLLVPVTTMIRMGGTWSIDNILRQLKARNIRELGGADKVADQLDANDAAKEKALKDGIRSDMDYRSRDAWRSYQARTGQRTKPTIHAGSTMAPSGCTA